MVCQLDYYNLVTVRSAVLRADGSRSQRTDRRTVEQELARQNGAKVRLLTVKYGEIDFVEKWCFMQERQIHTLSGVVPCSYFRTPTFTIRFRLCQLSR